MQEIQVLKIEYPYCGMYTSQSSKTKDSLHFEKILNENPNLIKKKESIQKLIFAKSTIEFLEVNEEKDDFFIIKLPSCQVKKFDDEVFIMFGSYRKYYSDEISKGCSRDVHLYLNNGEIETVIYGMPCAVQGSPFSVFARKYKIFHEEIKLNSIKYSVGDTLCGNILLKASFGEGGEVIMKGEFKAIVEGGTEMEEEYFRNKYELNY